MEADADGWLSLLVTSPPLTQWAEMVQNLRCHANNKQTNNSTTTASTGKTTDHIRVKIIGKALIFSSHYFDLIVSENMFFYNIGNKAKFIS